MKKKIALIFGITGQDGSYLSELLLKKKYVVHGVIRRSSSINTWRIDKFYKDPQERKNFFLHYGDITDSLSVLKIINLIKPTEIYNLAAQSHVKVSFETPEYTSNVDGLGALRILDAIKTLNLQKKVRFYQAGTSEMFGSSSPPQNEKTVFRPMSPYAVAKVYAHYITINYRQSYDIHASNGILFNHESPLRGETFVTKKIIKGLVNIKNKKKKKIFLGNIYAKRDWGHARDYVEAMWKILQQKKPDDYVISTDRQVSVKEFINLTAKKLKMRIKWVGRGINEKCYWKNREIISIDKRYFRPSEVNSLKGDYSKAKKILNWSPNIKLVKLVEEMIDYEIHDLNG